jgi:hypothetical protein
MTVTNTAEATRALRQASAERGVERVEMHWVSALQPHGTQGDPVLAPPTAETSRLP